MRISHWGARENEWFLLTPDTGVQPTPLAMITILLAKGEQSIQVKSLFRHTNLADQLGNRDTQLRLLQRRNDLYRVESVLPHGKSPSFRS